MVPYAILPLVAVVWLTVRYVRFTEASIRSKRVVVCLTGASFVGLVLTMHPLVFLLQIAICVYIILHRMVSTSSGDQPPKMIHETFPQPKRPGKSNPRDSLD
jgi:hypothetical protein